MTWLAKLQRRGVLRVAVSYALIAWLLLQIADVTFAPLHVPEWVMRALIGVAVAGLPIALALAWFFELTPAGIQPDTAPDAAPRPGVRGVRRYADVVIIGVLLAVVAYLLARPPVGTAPNTASVAVLPFVNIGGDESSRYLSEGLADELRDQLARVAGLRVSARSSSLLAKEQAPEATAAAKKLGVDAVMEGSVRREGERIRVLVQLVSGVDGRMIWSQRYDRELASLLVIQDDIASGVVKTMMPQFLAGGGMMPGLPAQSISGYELYLLAQQYERDETEEAGARAEALYRQAIALEPRNALYHAHPGELLLNKEQFDLPRGIPSKEAEGVIKKALALDPKLSEAHLAWGRFLRYSMKPGGLVAYQRAAELNPNNPYALDAYAAALRIQGRRRAGCPHALRARLEPARD
jgi:TolB-like protein